MEELEEKFAGTTGTIYSHPKKRTRKVSGPGGIRTLDPQLAVKPCHRRLTPLDDGALIRARLQARDAMRTTLVMF